MTVLSITYNKNLWPFNVTMQHHSLNLPTLTRCMHEPFDIWSWKHAIYSTSYTVIFNIWGMYNHMFMLIELCIFYTIIISCCVTSIHCYLAHFITQIHLKMGALIHWHKPIALPLGTKHNNMNVNKSTHTTSATYLVCHAGGWGGVEGGGGRAIRIPPCQQMQNQNSDRPTKSKLISLNNV